MNLPPVIPAKAGTQATSVGFVAWAPAFAGVTEGVKRLTMLLAVLTLTWSAPAQAQTSSNLRLGAELGAGLLDGDAYTLLLPYLEWSISKFHTGLNAPLRLRVYDGGAPAAGPTPGLRQEDWNGWSNKTRILRFAEWGEPGEPVHVRLGELNGVTLGHGTIVGRYYNNVDIDHYHTGLKIDADGGAVGVSAFASDLVGMGDNNGGPSGFVIGRAFARLFRDELPNRAIEIGTTWLWGLGRGGLDASVRLWHGSHVDVSTYADGNVTQYFEGDNGKLGFGGHFGLLTAVPDAFAGTGVRLRLEGRILGPGYNPAQIGPLYEIERQQSRCDFHMATSAGGRGCTPYGFVGSNQAVPGAMVGLDFETPGKGLISAQAEWGKGDGYGLLAWVILPEIEGLQLRAHYARRHAYAFGDLFDDQTTALASLRYRVDGPIYASLLAARRWHQTQGEPWPAFATTLELAATVGMDYRF